MAIDLTKLEKKFIDLFDNVTQEEFEQWLLTKTKPTAQQTAVDWLFIELYEKFEMKGDGMEMDKVLEQAKQMEREQRFKDFKAGQDSMEEAGKGFDQYYTKTYGK